MLKSISVHLYYRIFPYSYTSDKINIITTSRFELFGDFDYSWAKTEVQLKNPVTMKGFPECCYMSSKSREPPAAISGQLSIIAGWKGFLTVVLIAE